MTTAACFLTGGPADGDVIFTAEDRCASRLIIYRADTDEMRKGRPVVHNFQRPAVYVRDDAPQYPEAKHFHEGLDRVVRSYPVVWYRFSVCVDQAMASRMQAIIDREKDASDIDGASL